MRQLFRLILVFLVVLMAGQTVLHAQEVSAGNTDTADQPAEPEPIDKLGRDTPRGSLEGFLLAAEENDFVRAVEYLDLRNLPRRYRKAQPALLAEMLVVVIEREIWIDLEELSNDPEGAAGDGLPAYRDELGRIEGEDTDYVLLLQRVPADEGERIWKISNATVARIADLYNEFGYGPIAQAVADSVPDIDILGIELFKWMLTLGAGFVSYPVFVLLGYILARLFSSPSSPLYPRVKRFFFLPFALVLVGRVIDYVINTLGVGITAQKIIQAHTMNTVVIAWALVSLSGLLRDYYANRLLTTGRQGAVVLLRPGIQALQIIIVAVVFLVWLHNTGFNITTILAGLGVGGIAVALALQKPMEDIFGALSLYTLQPVKIGDLCRVGPETGTVEEIGLRTTRVRTLANSLISIPNSTLASVPIDNYSARERIRYKPTLRLRVDVSRQQVESILNKLRQMLTEHEKVDQEAPRVRFENIGEDALEIVIVAHVMETSFADYLIVAEELNLKIMDILESEGVTLAVPARSIKMDPQGNFS